MIALAEPTVLARLIERLTDPANVLDFVLGSVFGGTLLAVIGARFDRYLLRRQEAWGQAISKQMRREEARVELMTRDAAFREVEFRRGVVESAEAQSTTAFLVVTVFQVATVWFVTRVAVLQSAGRWLSWWTAANVAIVIVITTAGTVTLRRHTRAVQRLRRVQDADHATLARRGALPGTEALAREAFGLPETPSGDPPG